MTLSSLLKSILGRWAYLPVLGNFIQNAFFRNLEDIAVLALAFCHAHEITLKDLATYGVLQARPCSMYAYNVCSNGPRMAA